MADNKKLREKAKKEAEAESEIKQGDFKYENDAGRM